MRSRTEALNRRVEEAYSRLRGIAHHLMDGERRGHVLQSTALVHEAFFLLKKQRQVLWNNSTQFAALARQFMKRVLIDHGRRMKAGKRSHSVAGVDVDALPVRENQEDRAVFREALEQLAELDPAAAKIVKLRMGGLTIDEIAGKMHLSAATVERRLLKAREHLKGDAREL